MSALAYADDEGIPGWFFPYYMRFADFLEQE